MVLRYQNSINNNGILLLIIPLHQYIKTSNNPDQFDLSDVQYMFTPFIIVLSACRTNDSPNNPLELHGRWIALVWSAVQSASPKM